MSTHLVVGGGLAGLVSAYRLAQAGNRVILREAAPHWGGMISTVDVAGVRVDSGAEAYATRGGHGRRLCDELGLPVAGPEGTPHIWWPDGAFPMADGLLGIPASLADPALAALTAEEAARLAEDLTMGPEVGSDAHTIGELAGARLGAGAVRRLIEPVATNIYATPADHLPLAAVAPGIHDAILAEGSLIGAVAAMKAHRGATVEQPIGGMFRLIEALVEAIEDLGGDVRAAAPISALHRSGHGLSAHTHDGEDISADRVVLATTASVAEHLLAPLGPSFTPPPVNKARQMVIALSNPELAEHPIGSGVLVAARGAVRAKALTHYSAKWPWARESGLEVLRLSYPEHVFPARHEVLADASSLTGVQIVDRQVEGFASVSWDALPTRLETSTRDYLIEHAAEVGVDLVGAWLDGNGIGSVIAGVARVTS